METMEYITSVQERGSIKHIIKVNGVETRNVEVVESCTVQPYGNMQDKKYISFLGVKVFEDYSFLLMSSNDSHSLANVVFSIEIVRFVRNHLEKK